MSAVTDRLTRDDVRAIARLIRAVRLRLAAQREEEQQREQAGDAA